MPALLAAMLLGFLLIQPAICLIHCATTTSPQSIGPQTGSHLFCSLSQSQPRHITNTPVPTFWPALPAISSFVLSPATTWFFVLICIATYILSPPWSPPIPPPRGITSRDGARSSGFRPTPTPSPSPTRGEGSRTAFWCGIPPLPSWERGQGVRGPRIVIVRSVGQSRPRLPWRQSAAMAPSRGYTSLRPDHAGAALSVRRR
jgi:hypothetical protein